MVKNVWKWAVRISLLVGAPLPDGVSKDLMLKTLWILAIGGIALLVGERGVPAHVPPDGATKESAVDRGRKRPQQPTVYSEGPSIHPSDQLLEWLNFVPSVLANWDSKMS